MPASNIQNLAEQFCAAVGIPAPQLTPDKNGVLAFSSNVDGVDLTVSHDPWRHPDHAIVMVFFGQVPPDREVLVLRELLHSNLLMVQPHAPAFSRNPLTGNVILQYTFPLGTASGQGLLTGVQGIVESALRWRQTFFLDRAPFVPTPTLQAAMESRA